MQGDPQRQLDNLILDQALRHIAQQLQSMNCRQSLHDFGLPTPAAAPLGAALLEELGRYDQARQAELRNTSERDLNALQRSAFDAVMGAVRSSERGGGVFFCPQGGNVFFLDGPGGTGKTFTYAALLAAVRAEGWLALPVASSGVAALLMEGGRTAHSRLKIPVKNLDATATCNVSRGDSLAGLLLAAALIVWDEAVMMHKHAFEAVDRTLRDIMASADPSLRNVPFGGKVFVMGGDFRQILPVVPRGTRGQIVEASISKSRRIWSTVRVLPLRINMRVQRLLAQGGEGAAEQARRLQAFADYLGNIGNGTERVYPDIGENAILIPPELCCRGNTIEDLIEEVYGGLRLIHDPVRRAEYIIERAILTPLNDDVDALNVRITDMFAFTGLDGAPAQRRLYRSADSVVDGEQQGEYPTEFLNSLSFSGVPPHELHLQEGCPIVLLRNLTNGLANGTRLILKRLMDRVLDCEVATGPLKGTRVFIARLNITPSDAEHMPFTLRRRQFPVRPAFAMTINKAQGQTLAMVGLFLPKPVFSHGQLYVGKSRVGEWGGLKVLVPDGFRDATGEAPAGVYTDNVVYTEVFQGV